MLATLNSALPNASWMNFTRSRLTQRVDVVEECAQLFPDATPLTLLFQLEITVASKGRLAPLLQLEGAFLASLIPPAVLGRCTVRQPHEWQDGQPHELHLLQLLWQRATHDRNPPMPSIYTQNCGGPIPVCCSSQHVADTICSSSGRESVLERRTFLLEFCQELFCERLATSLLSEHPVAMPRTPLSGFNSAVTRMLADARSCTPPGPGDRTLRCTLQTFHEDFPIHMHWFWLALDNPSGERVFHVGFFWTFL